MKTKRIVLSLFAGLVVLMLGLWFSLDKDVRGVIATLPTNSDVLFWSQHQRDAGFRALDRLPVLIKARLVAAGDTGTELPPGPPIKLSSDVDAYMASQRLAGLLVVQGGKVRLERYGQKFSPSGRWTSFSVAKSVTSVLLGAAIRDGAIKSMDDMVVAYIPELKGSSYDGVSIRQLVTMTSGVRWKEDYADPQSDVARFNRQKPDGEFASVVSYMRRLPRVAPPGIRWNYSTGDGSLLGILISQATGKSLSEYLSEKVWQPAGMAKPATWLLSNSGQEISGCCIQASTRDFALFGQFVMNGAMVGGQSILPDGWLNEATTKQADIGQPGRGYGFQWWSRDDGAFEARGIFGQGIFIDPKRQLVIASNANWAGGAVDPAASAAREAFYRAVQAAIDTESAAR